MKLIYIYISIFTFSFCFVSSIEYLANISYEHEKVYEGDYLTQVKNFSNDISEEESLNEEYTSEYNLNLFSYIPSLINLGSKSVELDFVFIHYEVISEPPELIS